MSGELSPMEAGLALVILIVVVCGMQMLADACLPPAARYRVMKGAGWAT